jgi:signal transduction histidine kinase
MVLTGGRRTLPSEGMSKNPFTVAEQVLDTLYMIESRAEEAQQTLRAIVTLTGTSTKDGDELLADVNRIIKATEEAISNALLAVYSDDTEGGAK